MADPIIIGGVVVVAGVLTYIFWPSDASAAEIAKKKKVMEAACAAGGTDGNADGLADKGVAHNPRPLLNYSDDKDAQQAFENCYNDKYEKVWVAPPKMDVTKDATKAPGGAKDGEDAFNYGCSRGKTSGWNDRVDGYSRDSYATNLASDGSKKRQTESGDPARYRAGYIQCYKENWDKADLEAEWGTITKIGGTKRPRRGGGGVGGSRVAMSWREPYRPAFVKAA